MAHGWQRLVNGNGTFSFERVCAGAELELAVNRRRRLTSDCIAACAVHGSTLGDLDVRARLLDGLLSARSRWPGLACSFVWHRSGEDDDLPHFRYDVPTPAQARDWAARTLTVRPDSPSSATGGTALWLCRHRDMANAAPLDVYAQRLAGGALEITFVEHC